MELAKNDKPEITWRDNIVMCAERFSKIMEERFQIEMQSGTILLPPSVSGKGKNPEAAVEMLEIYYDYMFGTACALACFYASTDEQFEENVVGLVRHKIKILREMEKKGEFGMKAKRNAQH